MKTKSKSSNSIRIAVIGGVIVALALIISTLLMGQSAQKGTEEAVRSVSLLYLDELAGRREQFVADNLQSRVADMRAALELMTEDDLLIITADHGCDPVHTGTDHTREYIPILCWHKGMQGLTDIGTRGSYADIAATVSEIFGLEERFGAESFADKL